MRGITATVGASGADFCGADNRAIQEAVDSVARQGGGTVKVLPGVYLLHDSVHLRDNVSLVGAGPDTVLRKGPERWSRLTAYLGYGHYDVSVAEPDLFQVGMGVTIRDENAFGFYETVATLVWRDGDRFGIDQMLNHDYSPDQGGEIYTSFAPVSARFVANVEVRDITVDGNSGENPHFLNPCRGAGVFLLGVRRAAVANVTVRDLNGDAIGFQQCKDVLIEHCLLENNRGNGIHPGSGSVAGTIRGCTCRNNGGDGLFFCLRAAFFLCDSCEFMSNRQHGVSIGGRDTNNAVVRCRIEDNGGAGIYFRESDEVMAPHATLIARNVLADNCREDEDAEIVVRSAVRDVHVLDNTIQRRAGLRRVSGIVVGKQVIRVHLCGNQFSGEFTEEVKSECEPRAICKSRPDANLPVGPECVPDDADRHLPPAVRGQGGR